METIYNCSDLLAQYEQELETVSKHDYQMLEHRIEVLSALINCGVEYTTIAKLNQIH